VGPDCCIGLRFGLANKQRLAKQAKWRASLSPKVHTLLALFPKLCGGNMHERVTILIEGFEQ